VAKSYYAYNRDDLVKEFERCRVKDYTLTPVKQAIPITYINHFKYDDYSIYNIKITSFKSIDKKHTIHSVKPMTVKQFENIYNENGIKEGVVKRFYTDGTLKSETIYSNDIKNGIKKKYNSEGLLKEEIPYINGKINGVKHTYINRKLLKSQNYVDDKLEGKSVIYFPNDESKINIKMNYHNGNFHGEYIEYSKSGSILSKIIFNNGVPKLPKIDK
jgi:antitoxin component YwqK of YwqJK toxin-antitoxin module